MKKIILSAALATIVFSLCAQSYPDPEFTNEVYYLKKDNPYSLVRLEKGSSKMESKSSMLGGTEQGYSVDGTKSSIRLSSGNNLSFIISTGASASSGGSSSRSDSTMRANGIDPSMMSGMLGGMTDPSSSITLYKFDTEKDKRKILTQKIPGANPFGKHQIQSSDKYTFSVKKVKDGYWEMVVDKTLSKGEYAFTMRGAAMDMASMGNVVLFAFGVD